MSEGEWNLLYSLFSLLKIAIWFNRQCFVTLYVLTPPQCRHTPTEEPFRVTWIKFCSWLPRVHGASTTKTPWPLTPQFLRFFGQRYDSEIFLQTTRHFMLKLVFDLGNNSGISSMSGIGKVVLGLDLALLRPAGVYLTDGNRLEVSWRSMTTVTSCINVWSSKSGDTFSSKIIFLGIY